ncbi:MAG: hypothetical protein M3033_12480, partial [Acidobacteriota bacterium]|nr:hypothetical protein [Acidobacteriota bacterium]
MPVAGALVEVTIDGQKVTSEGTASGKLKFPAPAATDTGVFINLASSGGAVSTSGATAPSSSANTSSANVNTSNSAVTHKFLQSNSSSDTASSSLKFQGTWGLFRFFNAGSPQLNSSGEYTLTYKPGGKALTAVIKPSGGDLFNKDLFRSVHAPEKIFK